MPFDTTYHIYSADSTQTAIAFSSGGSDKVDFYYPPGAIPMDIDSARFTQFYPIVTYKEIIPEKNNYDPSPTFILVMLGVLAFIAFMAIRERSAEEKEMPSEKFTGEMDEDGNEIVKRNPLVLTYYGDELDFANEQYATILTKHYPYYNSLNEEDKATFIHRVNNFIKEKVFKIHSPEGFREMPVLISAAAIQLTFGLKKYLLTNFDYIHIFPQEFMRVQPTICFLEGNVSGHSINLSWKHFLQGIQLPDDGKNVGLHEMAHALYYQTFVTEENVDHTFRDCFNQFNSSGNKVYDKEMVTEDGLYSEYAMKNFQEFWAESVELFFEKPKEMLQMYPSLYLAMADVLNQNPAARLSS